MNNGYSQSNEVGNLASDLALAQKEMPAVTMDKTNAAYNSKYATLSVIQSVAFPILGKHGLAVLQS